LYQFLFFFTPTPTTELYTLSLHDALPISILVSTSLFADNLTDIKSEIAKRHDEAVKRLQDWIALPSIAAENRNYPAGAEYMAKLDRKSTRLNSSHVAISYAVFCLKKKKKQ